MKRNTFYKTIGLSLLAGVILFIVSITGGTAVPESSNSSIKLQAPPFLNVAHAEENTPAAINNFADDEAGIAAYFDAGMNIDLNDVDTLYRTIETQTADYILGSMPLTDYDEDHDVHMYISSDGWVMAYYRDSEPTSKIFDWRHYDGSANLPNKLALGLDIVAAEIGAIANPSYYHFRYPNATDMMLIAEWLPGSGTDSFDVNIPSEFSYYERSWSLARSNGSISRDAWYYLNGSEIGEILTGPEWVYREGALSASQLPPDTLHTISIEGGFGVFSVSGGLALVYQVP